MTSVRDRFRAWTEWSATARRQAGLQFWKEVLLCSAVYVAYSLVRNLFGSAAVEPATAARNADWIIDIEDSLGLYIEADVQDIFIDATAFIQFWNLWYGLFHFLITFGVLFWLYFGDPLRYRFWRRAGLITTSSALIGFAAFPLMPPRLLGDCGAYGACRSDERYIDTVIEIGGIWSFESTGMEAISNQYAAMPSLHIGWALWCALVLIPRLRSWPAKAVAVAYPALTLFSIVVTANHYWIDAVGGALIVVFGLWVSDRWDTLRRSRGGIGEDSSVDSGPTDFGSTVGPGVS